MPFDFGDLVLVPFPFTNQAASKQRHAVVARSAPYNAAKPDVILMAVISQSRPAHVLGEVWLAGWNAAGLLKPSAVKPVFAALEQRLVIRMLGALTLDDQGALRRATGQIIG